MQARTSCVEFPQGGRARDSRVTFQLMSHDSASFITFQVSIDNLLLNPGCTSLLSLSLTANPPFHLTHLHKLDMPPRGAGANRGRGGLTRGGIQPALPSESNTHITTVGVQRPNFGTGGTSLPIFVNAFETSIPEGIIHHYDGIFAFYICSQQP